MKALQTYNENGELITVAQAASIINVSRETARKIAAAAGAVRHIGRSYRIKRNVFLDYIEKNHADA